jgi:putative NIF3 family GTP cyclohydrolase 1 type 2
MPAASLEKIVHWCDRTLRTAEFGDYDGAVNGLQMENDGRITRIAAAVDGSLATAQLAVAARADLLIVHHGLFWSPTHPWTGKRLELLRLLLDHNLAVYSSHLPLDAHPKLGNNALLAAALGLRGLTPFFRAKGQDIGLRCSAAVPRTELAARLRRATGREPIVLPGGPAVCRRIGVVTGGAGPHWTFGLAEELGVNVLYGGHYATETFGVKALAAALSRRFKVPWVFLDHPSGL